MLFQGALDLADIDFYRMGAYLLQITGGDFKEYYFCFAFSTLQIYRLFTSAAMSPRGRFCDKSFLCRSGFSSLTASLT